ATDTNPPPTRRTRQPPAGRRRDQPQRTTGRADQALLALKWRAVASQSRGQALCYGAFKRVAGAELLCLTVLWRTGLKYLRILGVAATLLAGAASASSFIATTDTLGASLANTVEGTSDLTSSVNDDKLVLDARDDAARFVASAGEQRGARLQAALDRKSGG